MDKMPRMVSSASTFLLLLVYSTSVIYKTFSHFILKPSDLMWQCPPWDNTHTCAPGILPAECSSKETAGSTQWNTVQQLKRTGQICKY